MKKKKYIIIAVAIILCTITIIILMSNNEKPFSGYFSNVEENEFIEVGDSNIIFYGHRSDNYSIVTDYLSSIGFVGTVTEVNLTDGLDYLDSVASIVQNNMGVVDSYWLAWNEDITYNLIILDGQLLCEEYVEP